MRNFDPLAYFTFKDIADISRARSFEDLRDVAIRVIHLMGPGIHMVSGPITTGGTTKEENLKRFGSAIYRLGENGVKVLNVMPFEEKIAHLLETAYKGDDGMRLLSVFYLPILESGLVTTLNCLPDWKSSFGARWEHAQAARLGIRRRYLTAEELSSSDNYPR